MEILSLITHTEGKTLEFKRDISSLKPIMKTLIAFANTAGGVLIIGRDANGQLVGIRDVLKAEEQLSNAIADSIRPALMPEIEIVSLEGKAFLVVRVPHWRGPFYLKAEGAERGVYVRLGSTNRMAGPEILAEMQRSLSGVSFDITPCVDLTEHDLDMIKARRIFKSAGLRLDKSKLESIGILVPFAGKLIPSIGGIILFGNKKARSRICTDARVSCARFRGIDKSEFLDRLDIEGTVLDALTEAPTFIRRNTRLAAKIKTMVRRDIPEYPELAVREILANAVAHADYSLSGMRIMVAVFDDRMEIQNPGMLPFGMTLDDMKAGVSKVRNRVIVRVLGALGLVEEWGSGYKRVIEACRAGGYQEPEWLELGSALRIVFHSHPDAVKGTWLHEPVNELVNDRQQWFLAQLGHDKRFKVTDLSTHWRV